MKTRIERKVLRSLSATLIKAPIDEGLMWQVDSKFLDNFTGNKRVRKKKAKKMIERIMREVIIPYAKEVTKDGNSSNNI